MYTSGDRKCHFQGHVTLTYKVTRQGHDIRSYSIDFPEVKKYRNKKKNHCCSMYTSGDRKCHFQGHGTLTYKVTRQGHDIRLYAIDFSELKNLRNKNKIIAVACIQAEIESVTFKVTWPWLTRSPVKATTFAYIPLTFLKWKSIETKKIIAVACIQAEIESVTFKVTWPWRTRSPVKATILAYIPLTFLSGKTLETKKRLLL